MNATVDCTVLLRAESEASPIETPKNLWVTLSDNIVTVLGEGVDTPGDGGAFLEEGEDEGKTLSDGDALVGVADVAL